MAAPVLSSPERRRLLAETFPHEAVDEDALRGLNAFEVVALLAVCPSADALRPWAAMRWVPPLRPSVNRWEAYAVDVERRVLSPQRDRKVTIPCARCGSVRVTIVTKQLRRADEGATCGMGRMRVDHAPHPAGGVAPLSGMWAHWTYKRLV